MVKAILSFLLLIPATPQDDPVLTGVVKYAGPRQKPRVIPMAGDPKCAALCAGKVLKDDFVVDAENNVRWAFVYVKRGLEGKKFAPSTVPALLDQKACMYAPHVLGVMAGQPLEVRNSDALLHNVKALTFANKEFNFAQAVEGQVNRVVFNNSEVMIKLSCGVHPWMGAWVGVVDHPFFAVTDAAGKFEIKGLPAGKYTVAVWHEKLVTVEQEIEVKGPTTTKFTMDKLKD